VVPGCPLCSEAREALGAVGKQYTERDVENDFGALRRMYKNTRQSLVPVIECDGKFYVRPSREQIRDL
jgi:glutaredoxin